MVCSCRVTVNSMLAFVLLFVLRSFLAGAVLSVSALLSVQGWCDDSTTSCHCLLFLAR